jgi:hypothetical protein
LSKTEFGLIQIDQPGKNPVICEKYPMFRFPLLFLSVLLLFNSCQDDEEGVPVLTLRVQPDEAVGYFEDWVFISDDNGKLLDIWKARNNGTYVFKSRQKLETVNITYFSGSPDSQGMTTYTNVPVGQTLHLRMSSNYPYNNPPADVIGFGYVVVKNFDESRFPPAAFLFSDGTGTGNLLNDFHKDDETVTFSIRLSRDAYPILVTSYRDGKPVYRYIETLEPQDTVSIDFSELALQDHLIDLKSYGYTSGSITGIKTDKGYISRYHFSDTYMAHGPDPLSNPMLGYLDGFDVYETSLYQGGYTDKKTVAYYKYGEPPESITPPTFEAVLSENSSRSATATINVPYSYKSAAWNAGHRNLRIYWQVYSGKGDDFLLPDVPSEIIEMYPQFHHANMDLHEVTYYQHLDDKSYGDFLNGLSGSPRADREFFRMTILK